MLLNHAPLVIAEQFGTLESLYPGRIDLGLGRAPGTDQATMRLLRRNLDSTGEEFPQKLEELRSFLKPPSPGQRVRAVPGAGLKIPIWLLGSGGFSAQLAGELGLPFASAGHFSPDNILPGLRALSTEFSPVGESRHAVHDSWHQRLCRRDRQGSGASRDIAFSSPSPTRTRNSRRASAPVNSFEQVWKGKPAELPFLRSSIIGSPSTVQARLRSLVQITQADELIIHSMIFDHEARRRSYEIVWEVAGSSAISIPGRAQ